ncbi:MAG: hypothetical protein ACJ8FS_16310 [Sphingomicrobium sp.]
MRLLRTGFVGSLSQQELAALQAERATRRLLKDPKADTQALGDPAAATGSASSSTSTTSRTLLRAGRDRSSRA